MPAFIDLNLNQALQALRLKQLGSVAAVKQAMTSAWQKRVIVRDVATGAVVRTQESVNSLSKAESLVPASAAQTTASITTSSSSSSSSSATVAPPEQSTAAPSEPSATPKESKADVATAAPPMSTSQSQATYGRVYVSNVTSSNIKVLPGVVRTAPAPAATPEPNTTKDHKSTATTTTTITTDTAATTDTTTKKKAASTDESKSARKRTRTNTRKKKERVTNEAPTPEQTSFSSAHSADTLLADGEVMGADMGPEVEAASPLSAVDILRVDTSTYSPLLQPNLHPELLVGVSSAHAAAPNLAISPAAMSSADESSSTLAAVDTEAAAGIFSAELTAQSNAAVLSALRVQAGNAALTPQAPVDYDLPSSADSSLGDTQEGSLELRRKDQLSVAPALNVVPHSVELSAPESGAKVSGDQESGATGSETQERGVGGDYQGSGEQNVVTTQPQNATASTAAVEEQSEKTESAPVEMPAVTATYTSISDSVPATNTQSETNTEEQPATTTATDTDTAATDDDNTVAASSEDTEPPAALSLAGAVATVSDKSAAALSITPHTLSTAPASAESNVAMTGSDSETVAAHFAFAPAPETLKAALQVPQPDTSAVQIVTPDTTESKTQEQSELALHREQPEATLSALDTSSFTIENDAMARQPAALPPESTDSDAVPAVGTTGDLAASLEAARELKSVGSATALTDAQALLADSESADTGAGAGTETDAGALEIVAAAGAVSAEAANDTAAHSQGESALRSMASVGAVGTAALAEEALSVESESAEESTLASASTLTLAVAGESASAVLAITSSNQSSALVEAATVVSNEDKTDATAAALSESRAVTPEAEAESAADAATASQVPLSDLHTEAIAAASTSLLSSSDHEAETAHTVSATPTLSALPDENAESLLGGDVFGASHTDLLGTASALFLGDTGTGAAPVSPLLASTTPHEGGLAITRATPTSDDDTSAP